MTGRRDAEPRTTGRRQEQDGSDGITTRCPPGLDGRATAPQLEAEVPDSRGGDDLHDVYRGLLDERFVEDLPAYVGQEVTVLGEVAEVLVVADVVEPAG